MIQSSPIVGILANVKVRRPGGVDGDVQVALSRDMLQHGLADGRATDIAEANDEDGDVLVGHGGDTLLSDRDHRGARLERRQERVYDADVDDESSL